MTDDDGSPVDDLIASSKEIRDRRKIISYVLERLPVALSSRTIRITSGPGGTTVIRSHQGQLVADCVNNVVAQFLADAPGYLRAFSSYIEQLEASAFHDRERRRQAEDRVETITIDLLAAADVGFKTERGQQLLQSALREAREHERSVTRSVPPNRQWRY